MLLCSTGAESSLASHFFFVSPFVSPFMQSSPFFSAWQHVLHGGQLKPVLTPFTVTFCICYAGSDGCCEEASGRP